MRVLAAVSLAAAVAACASSAAPESRGTRPNVVLILADDLGIGDARCYNPASKIPTPHLDRLAREGMRLTDAHSPSAVCTPTRYALLTGRYAWRTSLKSGVLWGRSPHLIEPGRMTLASLLKEHGYATACIGKWHLGFGDAEETDYSRPLRPGPLEDGFDAFFGIPASLDMVPYLYVRDDRPEQMPTGTVAGSKHRRQGGGGFWRGGDCAPDFRHEEVLPRITDEAVSWIGAQTEPFFLYFPLTAPHTPWLPSDEFRNASEAGYYGDFVAMVDQAIGRVLAALDERGLTENTLVVVTSDNGSHWPVGDVEKFGHAANLHYRGQKADVWEGGHRVPFLARWPHRIPAGAVRDDLLCLTDLMATFAAVVGRELPPGAGEDSVDQLAVLLDEELETPARSSVVNHSMSGVFAWRDGRWKLILGRGSGGFTAPRKIEPQPGEPEGQLYDLLEDPAETTNLWLERPELVAELRARLDRVR